MDHAAPLADRIVDTIIAVLDQHEINRPVRSNCIIGNLSRFDEKWDAECDKLRAALKEMIELDACAKF